MRSWLRNRRQRVRPSSRLANTLSLWHGLMRRHRYVRADWRGGEAGLGTGPGRWRPGPARDRRLNGPHRPRLCFPLFSHACKRILPSKNGPSVWKMQPTTAHTPKVRRRGTIGEAERLGQDSRQPLFVLLERQALQSFSCGAASCSSSIGEACVPWASRCSCW